MAPTIKNSEFKQNKTGVYLGGINGAVVERNVFNTEPISGSPGEDIMGGLYLDHSTAYSVQENEFTTYDSTGFIQNTVGLVVNDGGEQNNLIYNNYFERQEWALMAQGRNRNDGGSQGLRIKCNEFYLCENDICVTGDNAGIAAQQGNNSNNPEDMAGNLFHIEGGIVDWDFDDINNEGEHFTYYYPSNAYGYDNRIKPRDYTDSTISLYRVIQDWTSEEGCPSHLRIDSEGIDELKSELNISNWKIDSTQSLLTILIDGGNTEVLQDDVEYSTPPESMEIYNDLMSESPYLSDTVVSTAIYKEDVLPNAMIRDVMVANPNTAKSNTLMGMLDERFDPMPDYMKAQIIQGRSILSIREETEANLAGFKAKKARAMNSLVHYYKRDTVNPQASADSLILLYQNEDELWAKYALAFEYLERGDSANAMGTLVGIPANFTLTNQQLSLHQQYVNYFGFLLNLETESKTIFQADSAEKAELYSLLDNSDKNIHAILTHLLTAIDTLSYLEPYIFPDALKSGKAYETHPKILNGSEQISLKVHPNPANDYLIIECQYGVEKQSDVYITDMNGRIVSIVHISEMPDQRIIDTQSWKPGIYIATLKIDEKFIKTVKFSIVK